MVELGLRAISIGSRPRDSSRTLRPSRVFRIRLANVSMGQNMATLDWYDLYSGSACVSSFREQMADAHLALEMPSEKMVEAMNSSEYETGPAIE